MGRVGLLVGVVGLAATTLGAQSFRAGVSLVRIPVVVTGSDGTPIRGLSAADFEVREDGRPQSIAAFVAGPDDETLPLHLGLMLDKSQSMEADMASAASAVVKFVELVETAVDVTFVEFDSHIRLGRYSPDNYLRLFERIRRPALGMRTALYDAIAHYLDGIPDRTGQHVLVVYTDGGDSASRLTAGDVRDRLRLGDVVLYVVGYLEHQGRARFQQQVVLTQLARETGGEAFFPVSAKQLSAFYDRIRQEIAGRYVIGFAPSGPPPRGEFRRIEVRLTDPAHRKVRPRTRSGYIAVGPP